jgi:hypothetical protein
LPGGEGEWLRAQIASADVESAEIAARIDAPQPRAGEARERPR